METQTKQTSSGVYAPTGEELTVARMIRARQTEMESGTDYIQASKGWDRWRRNWEGWRKTPPEKWMSNHIVPITTGVVESALSEMSDQIPQPIILPFSNDDKPQATVMKHAFKDSWEEADSDSEVVDLMHDTLITGTGIGYEYLRREPRVVRHIYFDKKGKEQAIEEEIVDFDGCYLENVKLEDFRVDENARSFTGSYAARDCMRRFVMDFDSFRNFYKGGFWDNLGNVANGLVKVGGDVHYPEWYSPPSGLGKNQIEVWLYHQKIPKDYMIVVANGVVVRLGPNPSRHKQLPYVRAIDVKRTHRFYGKGESELLESIQDEKDLLRQMTLDRNHLDIDKMFIGSNRSQLSDEDLIARPHGFIPADDPNSFKAVEYGDVPSSVGESDKALDDEAAVVSGIDPRFNSLPSTSTATQAAIIKETTLKRIRMKLRRLERDTLIPLARLRVSNILQYYSVPRLEKIMGEKNSAKYMEEIRMLKDSNRLTVIGDTNYRQTYRNIEVENKELSFDRKNGTVVEKPYKGSTYFEMTPETFVPARGMFKIKFAAGSTLSISEPLMQTKAGEMYDRLIQNPAFDPQKLGDLLLETNNYDPDDYHAQMQAETDDNGETQVQQLIDLAMQENQQLLQGIEVPPTQYATPAHTQIHVEFMQSDAVPKDPNVLQLFTNHVIPEIASEEQHMNAGGQLPGMGENTTGKNINKMTSIASGEGLRQAITPGKATKMRDIIPGKITGSQNLPVQI
jgi:hypothetical protein